MKGGYLRGSLARPATQRQMDVLAAFVAAGGSVSDVAELVGIRPSTVKRVVMARPTRVAHARNSPLNAHRGPDEWIAAEGRLA